MHILNTIMPTPPRPIMNRVLIEPLPPEEKSSGGIIRPDTAKLEMNQGRVIGLGTGRRDDHSLQEFEVKIGDKVMFKLGTAEITIAGVRYFLVQEEDIIAVL